jgi:hypothetical protein
MTEENNLPRPVQPGTGAGLGPSNLLGTSGRVGTPPIVTGERSISILQKEVENLAIGLERAAKSQGTDSATYRRALKRYQDTLARLNRERGKVGLEPVSNLEELEKEVSSRSGSSNSNALRNELKWAQDTYGPSSAKAREVEQKIAEADALLASSRMTPGGVTAVSQTGLAGYVPDLKNSRPILNPADFTITVVDQNNKPVVVGNTTLQDVFLVFEDKNFYERGVKTTVKNIAYRTAEDIRSLVFSLNKNDRKKLQQEFKTLQLLPSNYNANGELDRDGAFENAFLQAHTLANRVNFQKLQNQEPILGLSDAIKQYRSEEEGPTTQRNIAEFALSDGQAEGLLEEFYTRALGVRPSKKDIDQFKEIVRQRAGNKPRVTETTTTADGRTSTTKTVDTGFGAAEAELLARRQAEARPEFAPYQMATTFYDSLLRAAQSPVRLQDTGL